MADDLIGIAGAGGLDNGEIKAVAGKTRKGIAIFNKLDEECRGSASPARPAIQVTQQRRLVLAAQEDFRIALSEVRSDRSQAYQGA